jgi:hypothetical protein
MRFPAQFEIEKDVSRWTITLPQDATDTAGLDGAGSTRQIAAASGYD